MAVEVGEILKEGWLEKESAVLRAYRAARDCATEGEPALHPCAPAWSGELQCPGHVAPVF